jgi:hypothetical protein
MNPNTLYKISISKNLKDIYGNSIDEKEKKVIEFKT